MLSFSSAATIEVGGPVVESGDAGSRFVNMTAEQMCGQANVQAVYKCLGNVVRVVSSVPGEGSTFYKPEGKVVSCPVVEPTDMGAECLQMMTPNYCPFQAECGYSPAVPQVFPGQNDTPEQTGDIDAYIVEGEGADGTVEPEPIVPEPEPYVPRTRDSDDSNEIEVPANTAASGVDGMFGYLFYVVLLLGLGAIGVLFMLFKNTLAEEEA
ncbi:MAG: hypothetical protein AB1295_02555 [Candidatus Micrarchaeota archaeon]